MDTEAIPALDRTGLRRFGLSTAVMLAAIFGLLLPWVFGTRLPAWPWVLGGILTLWALAAPQGLNRVYRAWMSLALLVGGLINRIILGLVFFALVVPLGWFLRLGGRDPLSRGFDAQARSYRVPSRVRTASSMERPF